MSETLTFTPGDQSLSVSVTIIDDDALEYSENFFLTLSATDGAVEIENDTSSVYIIDNDCEWSSCMPVYRQLELLMLL